MDYPNFGYVAEALNLTKPAVSALIKRLISLIASSRFDKRAEFPPFQQYVKGTLVDDAKALLAESFFLQS